MDIITGTVLLYLYLQIQHILFSGEFGFGSNDILTKYERLPISFKIEIKKIFCSYQVVFFLSGNGKLYGSGYNGCGQLGLGHATPQIDVPLLNEFFTELIVFVSSGVAAQHTFAVTSFTCSIYIVYVLVYVFVLYLESGKVYGFGNNISYQLGIGKLVKNNSKTKNKIRSIGRGKNTHSSLLNDDEEIDYNFSVGTGKPTFHKHETFPVLVKFLKAKNIGNERIRITDIKCGENHTLFLSSSTGRVLCSGRYHTSYKYVYLSNVFFLFQKVIISGNWALEKTYQKLQFQL